MAKIRQISFRNSSGELRSLNGAQGIYATNPTGFGMNLSPSYADLGRGFYMVSGDESEPQASPAFTLVFTRNPYAAYAALMDWLAAAGTITLVYNPTGRNEYYRDVMIKSISKGELTEFGWLETPVVLSALGPWYRPEPTDLVLENSETSDIRRYNYTYTDTLRYAVDRPGGLAGTIACAGHIPAAFLLTYTGSITNPVIQLCGNITGKTYGICAINAAMGNTDTLQVSTRYDQSYVKCISADGTETDLIDALDIRSSPFPRVPTTEPCTISIDADVMSTGRASLQIFYYYRTV